MHYIAGHNLVLLSAMFAARAAVPDEAQGSPVLGAHVLESDEMQPLHLADGRTDETGHGLRDLRIHVSHSLLSARAPRLPGAFRSEYDFSRVN